MKSLNDYISKHYSDLIAYASSLSKDPVGLLSHTYIKARKAGFKFVDKPKADGYFKRALKTNAAHDFRVLYESIGDSEGLELIPSEIDDFTKLINTERIDEIVRWLDEFDRKVLELYLSGQNMRECASGSGVPVSTIYHSLYRSREIIKERLK